MSFQRSYERALKAAPSPGPGYYVIRYGRSDRHKKMYGPFATEFEAIRASYHARSVDERDAAGRQAHGLGLRGYLNNGYASYDEAELRDQISDPGAYEYDKIEVFSPKKLRRHPSWKELLDPERVFVEDLKSVGHPLAPR